MRYLSIYVHIPFCVQVCRYCDFAVSRLQKKTTVRNYLKALQKEIRLRLSKLDTFSVPSIYFGGGTPSLLETRAIRDLLGEIRKKSAWDKTVEVTLEANPETFDVKKATEWKHLGVNRISLGIQTFNPKTLQKLGRLHAPEETIKSFEILRISGFKNINLDLIYGLPEEGVKDFEKTLNRALELKPEHISLYQLAVEEHTPFFKLNQQKKLHLPTETVAKAMYETAIQKLDQAGFRHYELQNFSKPGFESTHNRRYWNHQEFLGFGVGAYSYLDGKRFGHGKSLAGYLKKARLGNFRPEFSEIITNDIKTKETIILGLRLKDGINLDVLEKTHDIQISPETREQLEGLAKQKFLYQNGRSFRLTLQGEHLSESLAVEII